LISLDEVGLEGKRMQHEAQQCRMRKLRNSIQLDVGTRVCTTGTLLSYTLAYYQNGPFKTRQAFIVISLNSQGEVA